MRDFTLGKTTYSVEKADDSCYLLTGPRGGLYGLLPCRNSPDVFYAVGFSCGKPNFTKSTPFYGIRFTIDGGQLSCQSI